MTVKECYEIIGDYNDVLSRLGNDDRIKKFAGMFLKDPSMETLESALAAENYEDAFRAAHTLKGVCQNLGLSVLFQSSNEITESMRGGKKPESDELLKKVKEDYALTIENIKALVE